MSGQRKVSKSQWRQGAFITALLWLSCATVISASAQSVSFATAQRQTLDRSFDLKIAKIDRKLAQTKVLQSKVPYYPTLVGSMNSEYIGGLTDQNSLQSQQAVVVGNTILPGNTRFQNAISLNTNFTAMDFGGRANTLKAARHYAAGTDLQEKVVSRDISLEVLDAFTQALLAYKELQAKKEQEALQTQLYEMKSRYWTAGKISRIELGEQAIEQKICEKELQESKQKYADALSRLSSYTRETYSVSTTILEDLDELPLIRASKPIVYANLPDFRSFAHLILQKQSEMSALKAQRYPKLVTYGSFVLYGANQNNFFRSVGDLQARQITMGIGLQLPIFDGNATRYALMEKKCEIEAIKARRDKRLWELRNDFEKSATAVSFYGLELSTKAELVNNSKEQLTMTIRLTESQVQEKAKALTEQIGLISRRLDEDKTKIQRTSAATKLRIYAESQSI